MNESKAEELVAKHEGKKEYMYHDSKGIPTIGIGFNLHREGARAALADVGADYDELMKAHEGEDELTPEEKAKRHLTEDQIRRLFLKDLANAESDAKSVVSDFGSLSDARQFVVVDMIFNLGKAGFQAFHHAIAAIDAKDFAKAAAEMEDSSWYRQVGDRAVEDCKMMKTGEWA